MLTVVLQAIDKHDHGFTIHVERWEPESYTTAMKLQNQVKIVHFLAVVPIGVAAAVMGSIALVAVCALCWVGLGAFMFISQKKASSHTPVEGGFNQPQIPLEQMRYGGSGNINAVGGAETASSKIECDFIVNCGGCASDSIAQMVGDDSFKIKPRLGEYLLLNKDEGDRARHVLFPCPGPLGKGVLVQQTLWGNLILGPTARDCNDDGPLKKESNEDIMTYIVTKCHDLVPTFDLKKTIHAFCGARAKSTRGDWIIEPCATAPRMVRQWWCGVEC